LIKKLRNFKFGKVGFSPPIKSQEVIQVSVFSKFWLENQDSIRYHSTFLFD
jgi:hypothetical protein